MKAHSLITISVLLSPALSASSPGGWSPDTGGLGTNCLSNCSSSFAGASWTTGLTSTCGNSSAIDSANSCIASSTCSDGDKQSTYQALAQVCANAGQSITASPEATYSATSGGTAYPTSGSNTAWQSYASQWATVTAAPSASGKPGWAGGAYGPFGAGGPGAGYGAWSSSGQWTSGPWTSWWGTSACPPSSWSGWTSGTWSTNAPWTTWTGCTASTTATSVITSTASGTSGGSASVITSTSYGLSLAQATSNSSSATTTAASGADKTVATALWRGLFVLVAVVVTL